MSFEILLILFLIVANGVFAMAEIAVVSARKARLKQMADEGRKTAAVALELANNPDDFLSTVQIGITLIGTLAGAFGGATVAERLTPIVAQAPVLAPYAATISLTLVVVVIAYLSLIIGELTPKRLGLARPEAIASSVAPIMKMLARLTHPVVSFLSWSTDMMMKIIPMDKTGEAPVTEEEIRLLIQQGTAAGAFEEAEQSLIEGVFRIADRRVSELMTPRHEVVWLDLGADAAAIHAALARSPHSRFPVGQGSLDNIAGIVLAKDLFLQAAGGSVIDLQAALKRPLFLPEGTKALRALELFQTSGMHFGLVVNEHGGVEGVTTLTDLMQSIVGRLPDRGGSPDPRFSQRPDGSWNIEGGLSLSELKELLPVGKLPREEEGVFSTVGGFIMTQLGRIPKRGDQVVVADWQFRVDEMDGNRVGKVTISGPGHGRNVNEIK